MFHFNHKKIRFVIVPVSSGNELHSCMPAAKKMLPVPSIEITALSSQRNAAVVKGHEVSEN